MAKITRRKTADPAENPVAKTTTAELAEADDWAPKRLKNVTISNSLARAAHGLTLVEKRVVSACIALIQTSHQEGYLESEISAKDYAHHFKISIDEAYKELKRAGANLMKRQVSFFDFQRTGRKNERVFVQSNWVQHVEYEKKKGYIKILWTHYVGAHLKGLKGNFTTYKLQNATSLRSVYSWRMLELFESNKGKGWCEMTVDDFATMMEVPAKQRKNFGYIKRRIIDTAIKDMIAKDGWLAKCIPQKKGGRQWESVRFEFKRDPQGRLFDSQTTAANLPVLA